MCEEKVNLFFFHRALKGLLVRAGEIHHLCDFGFGNFEGKNPANANAAPVNVQHDVGGFLTAFGENTLQNVNHEFHRRVIIVQKQDLVHGGFFGFRPCLDHQAALGFTVPAAVRRFLARG